MKNINNYINFINKSIAIFMVVVLWSCGKDIDDNVAFSDNDITIAAYLEKNPNLSGFIDLAKKGGYAGMLGVYGTYTAFAFTNTALDQYKQQMNITEFTDQQAKRLIQYHILKSAVTTETMGNGGLSATTIASDYIETSFADANTLLVNRLAKVISRDIELSNGMVHIIDKVLPPKDLSIRDIIFNDSRFSIFKAAWEASNFDAVYQAQINPITFFIVSDEVYKANGIEALDDLRNQPYIDNDNAKLCNYVGYHALLGVKFLNFIESGNYPTLGAEMMSIKPENVYKINKENVGGVESYIGVLADESNYQAKNGVVNVVDKILIPKNPKAEYLYFDFWEQPEVMALANYKVKTMNNMENMTYSRMSIQITGGSLQYFMSSHVPDQQNFKNKDHFNCTDGRWTVELTTPMIAAGKYRIRLVFKKGPSRAVVQASWDNEKLGDPVNMRSDYILTDKDEQIASDYRHVTIADMTFSETKEHVLKLQTVVGGNGNMDGIEFLPID